MKNYLLFRSIAAVLAVILICSMGGCATASPTPTETTEAPVISPFPIGMLLLATDAAVKIEYNAVGQVTAVTGVNKQGLTIAAAYTDFADKDCATAVSELIQLSADNSYLPESVKTVVLKQIPGSKVPNDSFLDELTAQAQTALGAAGSAAKAVMIYNEQLDDRGYISAEAVKALLQSYLGVEKLESCSGADAPDGDAYSCTVTAGNETHTYNIDADTGIIKMSAAQDDENGDESAGEDLESVDPADTDGDASNLDLNVISFNIRYIASSDTGVQSWSNRSLPLAKYLIDLNADIICMQESASTKQYTFLKDALDGVYEVYRGSNGNNGGVVTALRLNAFTILKNEIFWLSETPSKFSIGWDAKNPRVCHYFMLKHNETGFTFNLFNTHLDHVGTIAPVRSMELITERIKNSSVPSILAGDMNEYETSETYKIATQVLQDTQKTAPVTDSGMTYNHWGKNPDHGGTQVDFIFASPSITPVSFSIRRDRWNGNNFYSDHYAVQAIFHLAA